MSGSRGVHAKSTDSVPANCAMRNSPSQNEVVVVGMPVARASPDPAAFEVTEREDLRSRSPSPELPAPEFPDTDPLASSTDTEPMTPDQS